MNALLAAADAPTLPIADPTPLFVGPLGFTLVGLVALVVLVLVARVVFGLAFRLAAIGAVVLGALWLLGMVSF